MSCGLVCHVMWFEGVLGGERIAAEHGTSANSHGAWRARGPVRADRITRLAPLRGRPHLSRRHRWNDTTAVLNTCDVYRKRRGPDSGKSTSGRGIQTALNPEAADRVRSMDLLSHNPDAWVRCQCLHLQSATSLRGRPATLAGPQPLRHVFVTRHHCNWGEVAVRTLVTSFRAASRRCTRIHYCTGLRLRPCLQEARRALRALFREGGKHALPFGQPYHGPAKACPRFGRTFSVGKRTGSHHNNQNGHSCEPHADPLMTSIFLENV